MNKLIEKIVERLEEEKTNIKKSHMLNLRVDSICWAINKAISIIQEEARAYNEVKTNADYIRNMTDEELAEFLNTLFIEGTIEAIHEQYPDSVFNWKDKTLDWLKAEREG